MNNIYNDRSLMIFLFAFSSMAFAIFQFGFVYLKDFLFLISVMKVASGMALVLLIFSFLGIISTSLIIAGREEEIKKVSENEKDHRKNN